jgi:hypothetical protein
MREILIPSYRAVGGTIGRHFVLALETALDGDGNEICNDDITSYT